MALDPYYNNVSLLLPMEGENNQIVFSDWSSPSKKVTANGNAKISTAQSVWGYGSGAFDGSGDYLEIPSDNSLNFGSSDFTIEGYFRISGNQAAYAGLISKRANTNSGHSWAFAFDNASVAFPAGFVFSYSLNGTTPAYISLPKTIVSGNQHHYSLSRAGATLYFGFDGTVTSHACSAAAFYASTTNVLIGRLQTGTTGNAFTGHLQDLRITLGVARYTANFTPPERLLTPELYGAKYLHRGTLPTLTTITGNVIVSGNGGAQQVIIREAATRLLVATATPNATTGDWSADVPPDDYDITYFAPDCQPVCHGPYTVT